MSEYAWTRHGRRYRVLQGPDGEIRFYRGVQEVRLSPPVTIALEELLWAEEALAVAGREKRRTGDG